MNIPSEPKVLQKKITSEVGGILEGYREGNYQKVTKHVGRYALYVDKLTIMAQLYINSLKPTKVDTCTEFNEVTLEDNKKEAIIL